MSAASRLIREDHSLGCPAQVVVDVPARRHDAILVHDAWVRKRQRGGLGRRESGGSLQGPDLAVPLAFPMMFCFAAPVLLVLDCWRT